MSIILELALLVVLLLINLSCHCVTEEDITKAVKRVTKKFGWKKYKILHNDDLKWDSDFAGLNMNKLGLVQNNGQHDGKY